MFNLDLVQSRFVKLLSFTTTVLTLLAPIGAEATPFDVSVPQPAVPPNVVTTSIRPMVMLTASKDHTLFGPIYTDFEDLDEDGIIDPTFKSTFKYYGYFDATKCYSYSTTDGRFNPAAKATATSTVVGTKTLIKYTCADTEANATYWSGNFLNWATMTRLDTVRKMLYGGKRVSDKKGETVLVGSPLTWDAHSFVKFYSGDDIWAYTPFTRDSLTKKTGENKDIYAGLSICATGSADDAASTQPVMRMVKGNVRFWSTVEVQLCRWHDADGYSSGTFGPKLAQYYKDADKGNGGIAHELTIPNKNGDGATYASGSIGPELNIRVKVCDSSWLGDERCQAFPANSTSNYKPYGLFQEFGYSSSGGAARAEFGLISGSYDYNHTAGALRKNMGDFADEINSDTGVFCHSASSGCATTLADGRTTGVGAIKTLDSILLYGRNSGHSYGGGNTPSNSGEGNLPAWGNPIGEMLVQALQYYAYDETTKKPTPSNPSSTSNDKGVGMPVTAWTDPLSNANATRLNLYGNALCRPLNVLALSPSALTFDGQANTAFLTLPNSSAGLESYTDGIGVAEGLKNTLRSVGSVSGKGLTAADDTNSCSAKTIGSLSNVNGICPEAPAMGGTYQVAGAALYGNTTKIRTPATEPSDLKYTENALKVKTLAASLTGGSPRIDVPIPGSNPVKYVYITPESVQAGGKVSAPLTFASINTGATYGSFIVTWNDILMGGDYDMDITGFLRYDLVKTANGYNITITTDIPGVCGGGSGTHGFSVIGVQTLAGSNANGRYLTHQHYSSGKLSGMPPTSEYLCGDDTYRAKTSTLFTGKYADTVCNVTGNGTTGDKAIPNLINYCTVQATPFPVSMTFKMVGETDALIKDPLWYAAKYGYFNSSQKNADGTFSTVSMPTKQADWDSLKSDGTSGSDGVPDGYFLARRPDVLEAQLRRALSDLSGKSNASPATSTPRLVSGSYRYDVSFDTSTYAGNVEAFAIDTDGNYKTTATWRAGQLLGCRTKGPCPGVAADAGDSRQIITNYGNGINAGTKFRWASLANGYKSQMTDSGGRNVLSVDNATATVAYVRGDQSKESSTQLRDRGANVLGPVVSATPWVQTAPAASYFGSTFAGYTEFASDPVNKARKSLLWVGANDGMLHAFEPNTGVEIFAYVPGAIANRLSEIPLQRTGAVTTLNGSPFVTGTESRPIGSIWPYVDGSPFTGDVRLGNKVASTKADWRTYVFGSLGRGGRGVFALDATNYTKLQAGEGNASDIFRWQFTADDDIDLGYITSDFSANNSTRQPMPIARMNNGKFAYLLGNGYKSTNGVSSLFILFVDGPTGANGAWTLGTDYIKITAATGPNNGLSQVMWLDLDNNGTADSIYAGDLQGNLWKFDVNNADSTQWGVAYKAGTVNKPLFTAKSGATGAGSTRLPITTMPQYAYGAFDGPVILFGTGTALDSADYPNTSVSQRLYGIWDRPAFSLSTGGRALPTDLTTLVGRTLVRQADGNIKISNSIAEVAWATQDGWYATLPGSSEMMVSDPSFGTREVAFTTIRPPSAGTYCTARPESSLFIVDPLSGTAKRRVLGSFTDSSGTTPYIGTSTQDQKVSIISDVTGRAFKKPGVGETCVKGSPNCVCDATTGICKPTAPCTEGQIASRVVGANTDKSLCFNSNPRQQWREIPGLRTDR